MQCGEKYRLTKVAGAPEHPSWWLAGGSAVHEATEVYDLATPEEQGEFDPDAAFYDAFNPRVEDVEASMTGRFAGMEPKSAGRRPEQDNHWWDDEGPNMVRSWIFWQQETGWRPAQLVWEHWGIPTPAVEMDVSSDAFHSVEVRAFLDRVMQHPDGTLAIVDIKTGSRKPDSPMQLGFYKVLLDNVYGININLGGYFMARKGEIDFVPLDKYTDEYVSRFVKGFVKAREMELYLPNVGQFCATCGVAYACWGVGGPEADAFAPTEPAPPKQTWVLPTSTPKLFA